MEDNSDDYSEKLTRNVCYRNNIQSDFLPRKKTSTKKHTLFLGVAVAALAVVAVLSIVAHTAAFVEIAKLKEGLDTTTGLIKQKEFSEAIAHTHTIRLFDGCKETQSNCTVSQQSDYWWYNCQTESQQLHHTGYYTVGMHCTYSESLHIEVATLHSISSHVWCECEVVSGVASSGQHNALLVALIPSGQCVLTVKRCPISSNILP